jgi:hypothetical protein
MRLGNRPTDGEVVIPAGKIIWWLYIGKYSINRYYDGGWRVFDVGWLRMPAEYKEGEALPAHRFAFSFWLPFDRA